MSVKHRRQYNSPIRAKQAEATRRRILDTAERLFASEGYPAVSVGQIASQAEVSVANLYLHFPGKAAIVGAMANAIAAAPDLSVEHVEREEDPREQIRIGAHIMRMLNERSWLVADILRSARGTDQHLAETWALWQRRHESAIRRALVAIQERSGLRDGLELDEAVDSFYALSGTDVYRCLVSERSWSPDRYERWLIEIGRRELLRPSLLEE